MGAVLALLPQLMALIPSITVGVQHIILWVQSIRSAAQQSGEWTPELENQFIAMLVSTTTNPAWMPDPPSVYVGKIGPANVPAVEASTPYPADAIYVVKVDILSEGRQLWCNSAGDCWMVRPAEMSKATQELFVSGNGMKFVVPLSLQRA